jgi:hypothetical protein
VFFMVGRINDFESNQQNFWHIGFQLFFRWIWIDRQTVGSSCSHKWSGCSSFIDGNNGESQFDYKIKTETRDLKDCFRNLWMTLNHIIVAHLCNVFESNLMSVFKKVANLQK